MNTLIKSLQKDVDEFNSYKLIPYTLAFEQILEHTDGEWDPYGSYKIFFKEKPNESICSELSLNELDIALYAIYEFHNVLNYIKNGKYLDE